MYNFRGTNEHLNFSTIQRETLGTSKWKHKVSISILYALLSTNDIEDPETKTMKIFIYYRNESGNLS